VHDTETSSGVNVSFRMRSANRSRFDFCDHFFERFDSLLLHREQRVTAFEMVKPCTPVLRTHRQILSVRAEDSANDFFKVREFRFCCSRSTFQLLAEWRNNAFPVGLFHCCGLRRAACAKGGLFAKPMPNSGVFNYLCPAVTRTCRGKRLQCCIGIKCLGRACLPADRMRSHLIDLPPVNAANFAGVCNIVRTMLPLKDAGHSVTTGVRTVKPIATWTQYPNARHTS
jgi:hypothetical protein